MMDGRRYNSFFMKLMDGGREMKIVILERGSVGEDVSTDCLLGLGEVTVHMNTFPDQVEERVKEADIIVANKSPLNRETLKNAKNVKLICEFATGYDNIDLGYCKEKGIKVANVVDYSTDAVAQHTFALLFYVMESLSKYDEYVKSGKYGAQSRFSNFDYRFTELAGKTWGIIGMGNIGKKVAQVASAFGCRVITHSVTGKQGNGQYELVDFDTLLKESDYLSLHCPLSPLTKNLINLEAMKKMKDSAYLINVARGAVVNNADLYTALTENYIAGAGLDVLEQEPITADNPLGKIMDSGKLFITPHMAWASVEARERVVKETYKNIEAFLAGENRNIVN